MCSRYVPKCRFEIRHVLLTQCSILIARYGDTAKYCDGSTEFLIVSGAAGLEAAIWDGTCWRMRPSG